MIALTMASVSSMNLQAMCIVCVIHLTPWKTAAVVWIDIFCLFLPHACTVWSDQKSVSPKLILWVVVGCASTECKFGNCNEQFGNCTCDVKDDGYYVGNDCSICKTSDIRLGCFLFLILFLDCLSQSKYSGSPSSAVFASSFFFLSHTELELGKINFLHLDCCCSSLRCVAPAMRCAFAWPILL